MAAVLSIKVDAADVKSAFGTLIDEAKRANAQLASLDKNRKRDYTRTLSEEKRDAIRAANDKLKAEKDAAKAREKLDKETQRKAEALRKEEVRSADRAAKEKIKIAQREAQEAARVAQVKLRDQERADRVQTAIERRGFNRRMQMARDEQRGRAALTARATGIGRSLASGALQIGSSVHSEIQDVRARRAAQESELNTILIQRGSTAAENAASRARIREFTRENHLDLGTTIDALRQAQGEKSALVGANKAQREQALEQTLRDVQFASLIDPNNTAGLTTFSAMLRQQGVSGDVRSQMLRNVAGMSFAGSVEAESALQSGLPGMLRAVSSMTANASPQQREAITRDVIQDFYAQLQTVAATGGRVGVTSNRIGVLRTALNNQNTQNELGAALNARNMTAEQRAEFNRAFTQGPNGQWRMSQDMANSPSQTAALFGHLFGNNATAVSNFLGTRGGNLDSTKQMLTKPATDLLTSYFAMGTNSQGQQVRQYEAVADMARQTITPTQEEEIRKTRESEDRKNLIDNENARTQALGDNTSALNRASAALEKFTSEHPILAQAGGALAGGIAPAIAGRALGLGGTAVGAVAGAAGRTGAGMLLNSAGAAGGIAGAGTMIGGAATALAIGAGLGDLINRAISKKGEENIGSVFNPQTWTAFGTTIADVFRRNPPVVRIAPQDAAIAAAQDTRSPAERNGSQ